MGSISTTPGLQLREEASQRWQAVSNAVSFYTVPGIEPHTSRTESIELTGRLCHVVIARTDDLIAKQIIIWNENSLMRKSKATVNFETGRFDKIDSAVIVSSVSNCLACAADDGS